MIASCKKWILPIRYTNKSEIQVTPSLDFYEPYKPLLTKIRAFFPVKSHPDHLLDILNNGCHQTLFFHTFQTSVTGIP
jgi:hypothetical protein